MHPILFTLGPFNAYSYGVMVAFGFTLAVVAIYTRASLFGLDRNRVVDLAVIMLISGVIGGRALYVVLNLPYYRINPLEIFNLSKGGLVWYGAFASAMASATWYALSRPISFWDSADLIAPYIAMAQGFGRLGCFLNGCCYGVEASADNPLSVLFPGDASFRHPTQLYSAAMLFALFFILRAWQGRRRFGGEVFLGYCILYPLNRFTVEFLRGDNPRIAAGMTLSQLISVSIFVAGTILFIHRSNLWLKRRSR